MSDRITQKERHRKFSSLKVTVNHTNLIYLPNLTAWPITASNTNGRHSELITEHSDAFA